jgi:general secretion pathway protein G
MCCRHAGCSRLFSPPVFLNLIARFMKSPRSSKQRGFTLLEMLVVMVIIGLMASLVGPRLFGKVDASKVQTAKTQIKMLKSALGILQLDIGQFPPADQGLKWLVDSPQDDKLKPNWKGPYVDGKLPLDPWGNTYQFRVPGQNGQPFSVLSFGGDGREGGEGQAADIMD